MTNRLVVAWLVVTVACGKGKSNDPPAGTAAGSASEPVAAPLPPVPPLTDQQIADAKKDHYVIRSGLWGSLLVYEDWVDDTKPGSFVHLDPNNLKWPAEAIHVDIVKRKPGEKVSAIVQAAALPRGYTEASVSETPPYTLENAGLETAYKDISNDNDLDNRRAGQISGLARGDTVYLVTCYGQGTTNSSGTFSSRGCFNAYYSFRPPPKG
jgi:hypothetical protein